MIMMFVFTAIFGFFDNGQILRQLITARFNSYEDTLIDTVKSANTISIADGGSATEDSYDFKSKIRIYMKDGSGGKTISIEHVNAIGTCFTILDMSSVNRATFRFGQKINGKYIMHYELHSPDNDSSGELEFDGLEKYDGRSPAEIVYDTSLDMSELENSSRILLTVK